MPKAWQMLPEPAGQKPGRAQKKPPRRAVKYQARSNGSLDEAEIEIIQKIGRRSLNSFTSADIRATEALARRYYQEMGEKSPFFRAWFGDWRANDNDTAVQIATQQADARGSVLNADTGWNVQISGKVFNETRSHNALNNVAARQYLPYINDIVSKAVLLDSFGVDSKKAKSSNSLLMHSLYAVADIGNGPEVLKLFVEEMNNPNSSDTNKRAYQLQNIEKASAASVRVQGKAPSSVTNTADTIRTVADLFAYVKRKDSNFSPNPSSKVVNADGTPKAVYHGTNAEFTVFHSSNGTYWFSESMDYAEAMAEERGGNEIMEAFLDIKEPYYAKLSPGKFSDPNSEAQIIREAKAGGYDGVVIEADTTNELLKDTFYVVFSPNQIKSATQNIGTFDKGNPDIRFSLRGVNQEGVEVYETSAEPYAYDSLVSKPDMAVTRLSGDVPGNRADVIYQAKQNAAKIGRFNSKDGSVSVYVKDMDSDVIIGRDGLKHSIDRRLDVNAPVILKAGEILSNSIRINEMTPKLDNASNSYVLIGAAENGDGELYVVRSVVNRFKNELVSMDVLYAINAKKEPAALLPLSTEKSALGTGSTISISELLDYVNDYFPDILPEEVLKHYGHESRPEGKLGESVLYSDRDPEAVKRNQILERQNEDLKDTVQYLKELVRLQGKVTDGTVYSRNSVEWAGKQMMKEAKAKGDIRELTEILEKTYRAMGEGSEDMTQLIDQAAGWLADHRKTEKPRLDSYAEGILKEMKGRSPGGKGHR